MTQAELAPTTGYSCTMTGQILNLHENFGMSILKRLRFWANLKFIQLNTP